MCIISSTVHHTIHTQSLLAHHHKQKTTTKKNVYIRCSTHLGWLAGAAAALSMFPTAMLSTASGVFPPPHRDDGNAVVPVHATTQAASCAARTKNTREGGGGWGAKRLRLHVQQVALYIAALYEAIHTTRQPNFGWQNALKSIGYA